MLCCLGDLLEDIAIRRPDHILPGADTHVRIERRRGGSAANTAVAAAALGLPVRFIGRVGEDAVGRGLVDALVAAGVDARVQVGGRTGTIVVLVEEDGDRTMLGDRGASADLEDLPPGDLDNVTWLHVPAYSLIGGRVARTAADALRAVRRTGGVTSVDVSSLTLLGDPEGFLAMIRHLGPDVTFANEDEFAALDHDTSWLQDDEILVVKRGPGPASVYGHAGVLASCDAEQLLDVADTTGAGDAFAAGFIAARMADSTLDAALTAGHTSAAAWLSGRRPRTSAERP